MCGIIVNVGKKIRNITFDMLKKIEHRGPDDFNIVSIENIDIAFVRLSINDKTVNGRQPFIYKNLFGVFNGEVYNYNELKKKYLLKLYSKSDSELFLPLYLTKNKGF